MYVGKSHVAGRVQDQEDQSFGSIPYHAIWALKNWDWHLTHNILTGITFIYIAFPVSVVMGVSSDSRCDSFDRLDTVSSYSQIVDCRNL